MDVKAILLVGGFEDEAAGRSNRQAIGTVPIAYMDVLGAPLLERVLQRLQHFGVSAMAVISDAPAEAEPFIERLSVRPDVSFRNAPSGREFWQTAEEAFAQYAQDGADLVIAVRVGPFVELDYEDLIQHHLDWHCRVTRIVDSQNSPLGTFVIDASRRHDGAILFRSRLSTIRTDCRDYTATGYCNPLQTPGDLRRLGIDSLLRNSSIRPIGTEIKPGVWVGDGARVHPKARVVAPAFIGAYAKIRASALVTRTSIVEHHSIVDCGTVVENSTILPYTFVGAGLDVAHSVVGLQHLTHLLRDVDVTITDERLISQVSSSAFRRVAGSAAALFAFLPNQIYRGIFRPSRSERPAETPEATAQPAAALNAPELNAECSGAEGPQFPASFAIVRRYGDQ